MKFTFKLDHKETAMGCKINAQTQESKYVKAIGGQDKFQSKQVIYCNLIDLDSKKSSLSEW